MRKAATNQSNRSYIKKRCQPKWARKVRTLLYFMHYSLLVFILLISDMRTGMYYSGFDSVGENQSLRWQQLLRHQDSSCRHQSRNVCGPQSLHQRVHLPEQQRRANAIYEEGALYYDQNVTSMPNTETYIHTYIHIFQTHCQKQHIITPIFF